MSGKSVKVCKLFLKIKTVELIIVKKGDSMEAMLKNIYPVFISFSVGFGLAVVIFGLIIYKMHKTRTETMLFVQNSALAKIREIYKSEPRKGALQGVVILLKILKIFGDRNYCQDELIKILEEETQEDDGLAVIIESKIKNEFDI